jgi:hypothetical protein
MDESGTPELSGNTSHFILAGLAIPINKWKFCDKKIEAIKKKYSLENIELHTSWILRKYPEQENIVGFEKLDLEERRFRVEQNRTQNILRLQKERNSKGVKQTKKNYRDTACYIHLTFNERQKLIDDLAKEISRWSFARLFAECIDKIHFNPVKAGKTISEQSFEQVISRFETFLEITQKKDQNPCYGLLIHDNNDTVAKKHTELMKKFYQIGTLWKTIDNIIETPLFVDSQLTSMIQVVDLCAYSLRRYLENGETQFFEQIYQRADRKNGKVEGIRHFTKLDCNCLMCVNHPKQQKP